MPPPGGYMSPYPSPYPPPMAPMAHQPKSGGAAAAFKWGAIFGAVAGVVNLVQVLVGVAVVNANLAAISGYQSSQDFQAYEQCIQSSGSSSACPTPTPNDGMIAVFYSFYGSCCAIFLLTFVAYLLAARFAAREAERRGPGIWAAVIAAALGSLLYIIFGVVAISTTGRSGLFFGLGPLVPGISTGEWTSVLVRLNVVADVVGLLVAMGAAALLGLGGAALGMRGVTPAMPPGMPPPVPMPMPGPAPYGPPPIYSPYGPPGMPGAMPGAMPLNQAPAPPPAPDYTLPAQYPPLPSHYESPPGNQGNTENPGNS